MKKTTINDVAERAGVSKATVSAVINGKPTVKASTRERVLSIMKELNFRPKGQARNLKRTFIDKSIGLLIRELDNPFYTSLAVGVKKYANQHNYTVFISSSECNHQNEEKITKLLVAKDIKGTIIAPVMNGTVEIDHLFRLKMLNFPFVLLEEVPGIQANVVSINNIDAIKKAVKFLVDLGHKRIIHFSGPEYASHAYERLKGFRQAFSESPLIYSDDLIIPCGSHFHDGLNKGLDYFGKKENQKFPMAVVCYNDVVALGLISALQKLNIRVPEDVSIIGNDDIEFARHWSPALTTISTPIEELGRKAAEILIHNIEAKERLKVKKLVLEAQLIIRETTCAVKK
ncbi:MAG: LacI family DNA-binding transcriptional regulator [Caldisericaceae bacterium]|nr:LacI family DNA-binding transcriptional regulator [Caldisericaceae bacterium]